MLQGHPLLDSVPLTARKRNKKKTADVWENPITPHNRPSKSTWHPTAVRRFHFQPIFRFYRCPLPRMHHFSSFASFE
jgi:hypothetical protein